MAVPWPSALEQGLIQWLTRLNVSATIDVLGLVEIPAIPHGNVIEVGTGAIGIDEACSGVRSFPDMLMISLFFGDVQPAPGLEVQQFLSPELRSLVSMPFSEVPH